MKRSEYMRRLQDAYDSGRISSEAYDAGIENADVFCDDDVLPETYAEIEYADLDTPEAALGTRFDDMNYRFYTER